MTVAVAQECMGVLRILSQCGHLVNAKANSLSGSHFVNALLNAMELNQLD